MPTPAGVLSTSARFPVPVASPQDELVRAVARTARDYDLLRPRERVLVACSGGRDSVALLHVLATLAADFPLEVTVGHVHHGLRSSADEDAAFVRDLAGRLGVRFSMRRLWGVEGPNLEARARAARYAALVDMARELGATVVATGHTLDDQAETVLLRLLRGTGVGGLAGILPRRGLGPGVDVVRPLLRTKRAELEAFLCRLNQPWREDETNLDVAARRNWVRHRILPLLTSENPRLAQALSQLAEVVRAEEEAWGRWVEEARRSIASPAAGGWRVQRDAFAGLPVALQRRLLRDLARPGNAPGLSFVLTEEARRLVCQGRTGSELVLKAGMCLRVEADAFWVGRPEEHSPPDPVPLVVPGRALAAELGLLVEASVEPLNLRERRGEWEADLDVRWASRPLVLRTRRPGDRIRLPRGSRKLQDLFTDLKVPRWERDRVAVVATEEGQVLWVVGGRVSEAAKPAPGAERCLRLRAWPLHAGVRGEGTGR